LSSVLSVVTHQSVFARDRVALDVSSASIQGFIVMNYEDRYPEAAARIAQWLAEGKIKRKFHVESGLERCPEYLGMLYSGANDGRLLVRISKEGAKL